MIENSLFYAPLIRKIESFLEQEFERTETEEVELLRFIDIYSRHKSLPSTKDIFATHSASEFCQLMR
jgi:hypothetical protein